MWSFEQRCLTPNNGYFTNDTVIPDTFLCLYFNTNKLALMASTVSNQFQNHNASAVLFACFRYFKFFLAAFLSFNEISLWTAKVERWVRNQFC